MKKSFTQVMRSLHRDIGFLVLGLTVIYTLSGIILIYRKTDFLKTEKQIELQVEPNLKLAQLRTALKMNKLKILKEEGDLLLFNNGSYNKATGVVIKREKSLPEIIQRFNGLHMKANGSNVYWATTIYGVLLLFLALSSFWMFKPKSKQFKRGLIWSGVGFCIAIVLVFM